jgi:hypothetical protein
MISWLKNGIFPGVLAGLITGYTQAEIGRNDLFWGACR